MHFYLGVTDNQWFTALQHDQASECNFWMPSGRSFGVLQPGQEFLFKLKAPHNHIGGGGTFVRSEQCYRKPFVISMMSLRYCTKYVL